MDYDLERSASLTEQFGHVLREALKRAYRKLPSAAFVARAFNLRRPQAPISQETARRWMRGRSMPDPDRLSILTSWLDIDCNQIFSLSEERNHGNWQPSVSAPSNHGSLAEQDPFYAAILRLSEQERELVYALIRPYSAQTETAKPL